MAAVLMMVGGSLGFLSALVGLFVLDFGLLHALAIWIGVGTGFCLLGLTCALLPAKPCDAPVAAERA